MNERVLDSKYFGDIKGQMVKEGRVFVKNNSPVTMEELRDKNGVTDIISPAAMLSAQNAKRITQNNKRVTDYVAFTEFQIMRAAMEGKTFIIRVHPDKAKDAERLKKALTDQGYEIDDQETMNGKFRPGSLLKISWD